MGTDGPFGASGDELGCLQATGAQPAGPLCCLPACPGQEGLPARHPEPPRPWGPGIPLGTSGEPIRVCWGSQCLKSSFRSFVKTAGPERVPQRQALSPHTREALAAESSCPQVLGGCGQV